MPLTVSLELEWVLRGAYRLSTEAVADTFEALLGMRHLRFEQEPAVLSALGLHRQGLAIAVALHHLGSGSCAVLLSFDRGLIVQGGAVAAPPTGAGSLKSGLMPCSRPARP